MPAVSLGTTDVARAMQLLSGRLVAGAAPAWSQPRAALPQPRTGASCRGGRSAFGWPSSGEWGGVLLADGSRRREGAGQQVADLVVRGAGARVAGLGVPVPVDGQQPGAGQVTGHRDRALVGRVRVAGVTEEQEGAGGGPVPRACVTVLGRGGRPIRARLRRPRLLRAEGARP